MTQPMQATCGVEKNTLGPMRETAFSPPQRHLHQFSEPLPCFGCNFAQQPISWIIASQSVGVGDGTSRFGASRLSEENYKKS